MKGLFRGIKLEDIEIILDRITKECYYKYIEKLIEDGLITDKDLEVYYKDNSELSIEVPSVKLHSGRKTLTTRKYKIEVSVFIGEKRG